MANTRTQTAVLT